MLGPDTIQRYVNLMPYPEFVLTLSETVENPEDAETDAQSAE